MLTKVEEATCPLAEQVAVEYGCELASCERMPRTAPAVYAPEMVNRVVERLDARGLATRQLWSAAGHDAQQLAAISPTAIVDEVDCHVAHELDAQGAVVGQRPLLVRVCDAVALAADEQGPRP
ncbi:hypothetical protein ACIOKD_37855 [Streptomyces sp. NPDC087844]|uniref:hypothetical protein n=1 Tax=Streptomyces sp. NPDC087844 TaxID=3365805 RepID=UPI003809A3C6